MIRILKRLDQQAEIIRLLVRRRWTLSQKVISVQMKSKLLISDGIIYLIVKKDIITGFIEDMMELTGYLDPYGMKKIRSGFLMFIHICRI